VLAEKTGHRGYGEIRPVYPEFKTGNRSISTRSRQLAASPIFSYMNSLKNFFRAGF